MSHQRADIVAEAKSIGIKAVLDEYTERLQAEEKVLRAWLEKRRSAKPNDTSVRLLRNLIAQAQDLMVRGNNISKRNALLNQVYAKIMRGQGRIINDCPGNPLQNLHMLRKQIETMLRIKAADTMREGGRLITEASQPTLVRNYSLTGRGRGNHGRRTPQCRLEHF